MFENLSDKLNAAFKKLKGHGKLTDKRYKKKLPIEVEHVGQTA